MSCKGIGEVTDEIPALVDRNASAVLSVLQLMKTFEPDATGGQNSPVLIVLGFGGRPEVFNPVIRLQTVDMVHNQRRSPVEHVPDQPGALKWDSPPHDGPVA